MTDRVTPCLWFDANAEEAVDFYVSLIPNSRVVSIARYTESGPGKPGSVLLIVFELDGRRYQALNGGADFPFSEAVSLSVACDSQAEIDRIWDRLAEGGTPQQCGWIKDRFGLPWQVVPSRIEEWITGDPAAADRVMQAVLGMVKLDIPTLERAHAGSLASV
jgi:predicted 3-demethylubiquinone-9 3-methyltransferase (glyoxalase superfamily)